MKEYGIAIAGIALALMSWFSQYLLISLPGWLAETGFAIGIFLLGFSTSVFFGERRKMPAKSAHLKLHIYNDTRTPNRLSAQNIFRWYYLQHCVEINQLNDAQVKIINLTLFIAFEPDVVISTLQINSPDILLPPHEVKEFNQRFAIIVFSGQIPTGTLEVNLIE